MRRLHRARRRPCLCLVRAEGVANRRQARGHPGRPRRRNTPDLGRQLHERRRLAVRLLLAGHRPQSGVAARQEGRADSRGDRARAPREPLPLHGLHEDLRRGRAGCGGETRQAPTRRRSGLRCRRTRVTLRRRGARARRPALRGRFDRCPSCCTARFGSPTIRARAFFASTPRTPDPIRASSPS